MKFISKAFKIFFWNATLLLTFTIVLEFVVRAIVPDGEIALRIKMNRLARNQNQQQKKIATFNIENFRFIKNIIIPISHKEYNYNATINGDGWRVPCFDAKTVIDHYIVGDSFIFGTGVEDSATFSCAGKKANLNLYTLGIPGARPEIYIKIIEKNKDIINKYHATKKQNKKPSVIIAIFTGNDYENLINMSISDLDQEGDVNFPPSSKIDLSNQLIYSKINSLLKHFNYKIVKNNFLGLGESYIFNGIKLLYNKGRYDGPNYYKFYSGSTFYNKNAPSSVNNLRRSLLSINSYVQSLNMNLTGFLLIPDPSEVSERRFNRDATLRGIGSSKDKLDYNYKFFNILEACRIISVKCIDSRKTLLESDYFKHDSHLKPSGIIKLVALLKSF